MLIIRRIISILLILGLLVFSAMLVFGFPINLDSFLSMLIELGKALLVVAIVFLVVGLAFFLWEK